MSVASPRFLTSRPAPKKPRATGGRPYQRWYVPYLFLMPGLAIYLVWALYPLLYQLYISFFDWKIMPNQQSEWVGLQNYIDAFSDKTFHMALGNTVMYAIITVIGQLLIGLALAVLVNRVTIGKRFFRTIYYLPVVTSWVVVSFLFLYLFSPGSNGALNHVLGQFGLIEKPISWMSSPSTSWVAIYALGIWKGMGWAMVIFLAALQGIPPELYEAAAIDGADEWRRFRHITMPLIRRTTLFVFVVLMIGGFQVFISVLLLTGGGPLHRTEVALTYMFSESFGDLKFGYGAALSYILAAFIVLTSVFQMRLFGRGGKDVEY